MTQPLLPNFDGRTYCRRHDHHRLSGQLRKVRDFMTDRDWHTLAEICAAVGVESQASVSARLRDLRKTKFGGYTVERRRRGEASAGLFEYRVSRP